MENKVPPKDWLDNYKYKQEFIMKGISKDNERRKNIEEEIMSDLSRLDMVQMFEDALNEGYYGVEIYTNPLLSHCFTYAERIHFNKIIMDKFTTAGYILKGVDMSSKYYSIEINYLKNSIVVSPARYLTSDLLKELPNTALAIHKKLSEM